MHTYILLDRSGSMSNIWDEILTSINAYVEEIAKPEPGSTKTINAQTTLATFDHQGGMKFDVIRDSVPAQTWENVSPNEVSPRGMTPLFDAVGLIFSRALEKPDEKTVIVIVTDGHENASVEVTAKMAKDHIAKAKKKGWEVVFLGANFDQLGDADSIGVAKASQMGMSAGRMTHSKQMLAKKARRYAAGLDEEIAFDAEDRLQAGEAQISQKS